jgi:oligopeptidase A
MTINTQNPLLTDARTPAFDLITPDHIVPAVVEALALHRAAMAHCTSSTGFDDVFVAKDRADAALSRVWQTVTNLHLVANTTPLRSAHAEAQALVSAHWAEVGQNGDLYAALKANPLGDRTPAERRAVALTLEGFDHAGVGLAEGERARFAAITVERSALSSAFADAVMDATESWTLTIDDPARLVGVPEADRAAMARTAEAAGRQGWTIDLHFPSVRAITAFAQDRDLRRTVYEAYATRASDCGPDAGKFDNGDRIVRLLALRQEAAAMLGFADAAALSLAPKMARDAVEVEAFLLDLAHRGKPLAQAELDDLAHHAREALGIETLEPWDIAYVTEKLREARHAIDESEIKRYLPLGRALDGLFGLITDLYGVDVRAVAAPAVWHPDVRYYELFRAGEKVAFASLFCDFFARDGKRGGAWMDVCRPRLRRDDGAIDAPIAYLVCNMSAPDDTGEAYLSHGDLQTLFHEMGHCLHHMLTEVDLPSIGGIGGVEWDAVELPSQFMENFAWEPAMLRRISAHADTGAPLDDATIDRMIGARQFMGAMALLRQVEFSLFDLRLHRDRGIADIAAVQSLLDAVRADVAVIHPPEWHRFAHAFGHIFSGGYAAGYYSYLWAERLSADAFEAFGEAGAERALLGARFRDTILAQGGSRPANDNFIAFRGREPDTAALLRARGLA